MSNIFDTDLDNSDTLIKTNNDYARNYDEWRKKEELNKLKTKYGKDVRLSDLSESSSSSEDDEVGIEVTEEVEKDFFKTLSCLKKKDPRIYDEKVKFFKSNSNNLEQNVEKKKKDKPIYLKDYERQLILKKGGQLSDEEDENIKTDNGRTDSPTYVEEQKRIKDSLKSALQKLDDEKDEEDTEWGGLLKARKKNKEEAAKEEADYRKWLAGQKNSLKDKEMESELKFLKDYWNDPNLDDGERFLRDYILNKKFLDKEDKDYIPTYEEVLHDSDEDLSKDEENIEKQEEFEHKYNFRFEEPDPEFIKRYPRTIENSLRRTDDRRKIKRQELKERKLKEKEEKRKELKKLQELKQKEIEEKIEKLKEITGNTDVVFHDEDIEGDFDPEEHDKRMQALFNEDFYKGPEEDQKPEFPEIDEELEIENWDRWNGPEEHIDNEKDDYKEPHCEDDDFIMDCDYDPLSRKKATEQEIINSTKSRRKRKKKSKFAEAVSKPKPKFNPNDKTYEKYLDEYYQLDCEDFIGDLPCRFKYRKVIPNDFGLTTEEILLAKERELNRWCSLKKIVQHRPDHVEKYDQIAFAKKGSNIELKKRILTSLFTSEEEKTEENPSNSSDKPDSSKSEEVGSKKRKKPKSVAEPLETDQTNSDHKSSEHKKKKKRKSKKKKKAESHTDINVSNTEHNNNNRKRKLSISESNLNDKKDQSKRKRINEKNVKISDARLCAYGMNPKKFKNKLKYGGKNICKK